MRRLIVALALCLLATGANSFWQSRQQVSAGGAPAYQGPGDIVSFQAFWGTRAYSTATRGSKLLNVCNSTGGTDVGCGDLSSDATTGALVPATIGGITCPGANCTVKIVYDISGNTNCTGACDLIQATIASRPTITTSCSAGRPCMACNGSQFALAAAILVTSPQPYFVSFVAKRTSVSSYANVIYASPQTGFSIAADNVLLFAGTVVSVPATDNVFHSVQANYSGASSTLYMDASSVSISSPGAGQLGADTPILCGSNSGGGSTLIGNVFETGVAGTAVAVSATLDANQRLFFGL